MMYRKTHLSEAEMLIFIELKFSDYEMRSHVEICPTCRSLLADSLVLVSTLQGKVMSGNLENIKKTTPAYQISLNRFLLRKGEDEPHSGQLELIRFYAASHLWEEPDHDFFSTAKHLLGCEKCLANYIALTSSQAPDLNTMKKVFNMASSLSSTKIQKFSLLSIKVGQDILENLLKKVEYLLKYPGKSIDLSLFYDLREILRFKLSKSYEKDKEEFVRKEHNEFSEVSVSLDARLHNLKDRWIVVFKVDWHHNSANQDPIEYELIDIEGKIINFGLITEKNSFEVPAEMPVSSVMIFSNQFSKIFPVRFPHSLELELITNLFTLIDDLHYTLEKYERLISELDFINQKVRNNIENLMMVIKQLDKFSEK